MCYLYFEITVEDANLIVNDGFKIGQTSLSLCGAPMVWRSNLVFLCFKTRAKPCHAKPDHSVKNLPFSGRFLTDFPDFPDLGFCGNFLTFYWQV